MRSVKLIVLYLLKAVGLFGVARWLTRDSLKILCYHGFAVSDEAEFRPKLFISRRRFEQRLEILRGFGMHVIPLDEAIDQLYSRTLPKNSIVITIDDGFHSVHRLAMPSLRRHGYPATVYVTTYYVENPNPIFRLAVQYMFWKTHKRELVMNKEPWAADGVVNLANATQSDQLMWDCINFGERECTEQQRCEMCELLGALLEVPYQEIVRSKALHLMTPPELRSLGDARIAVELHTHRHVFPNDDRERAEREIADNRRSLQQCRTTELRHFCYPSGLFDAKQQEWLDDLRLKSSVTCLAGLNSAATPRHALRRFLDGENIHRLEFEAAVSGLPDLVRGWLAVGPRQR